jgi:hypothetical protein
MGFAEAHHFQGSNTQRNRNVGPILIFIPRSLVVAVAKDRANRSVMA